jgi:hypothetical protein
LSPVLRRPALELLSRACVSVAASVILISSAGVTPANAAESFTPTWKDMLSIQAAIEHYERGLDTRDSKLQKSAFWDDAVLIGPQGKLPLPGAEGPLAAGGPPGGRGGARERYPSCDPKAEEPATGWAIWHIVANSSFEFLSPTRVKHHAYWFEVCPSAGSANGAGIATVGPPGSYNDILEKRHGEWRFIERNVALNEKYTR